MPEAEATTSQAQLIAKRGHFKGSLTRFTNFLRDCENTKRISELQVRLENFEGILSEFDQVQYQIETADTSDAQSQERESFENSYFAAVASARDLIAKNKTLSASPPLASASSPAYSNSDPIQGNIQLPKINLPEFNGAYDHWLRFHDTFKLLIHNNSSLNRIQKFYYLQSALKGKAAQVIQSRPESGR